MATAAASDAPTDLEAVREVLRGELGLAPAAAARLTRASALFGDLPELDSMAVARVLTALEDRFGFHIDDDEVDGALFETMGSLADFVAAKRAGSA